jgi:sugar phosphate isomerase/epimerase
MTPPVGKAFETGPKFDMLGAPKYLKDNFGITGVEVWNYEMPDSSLDFCRKVRAAAEAIGSRITNLQVDGPHNLSAADPVVRASSVEAVKEWMDKAKALGAPGIRSNIGSGNARTPLAVGPATESFTALAEYGKTIGVKIMVENHGSTVEAAVAVLKAVNHPFCRGILDWGFATQAATTPELRLAEQSVMFPYVDLVSAKGLHFDAAYNHIEYPIAPIVAATEAAGFKGVYSIELYAEPDPPPDTDAAMASMIRAIAPGVRT